jgi:hypothetical protein
LNQLAWEMWEKLEYKEIDPSVISRVLKGKRSFTNQQLKVFCTVMGLTGRDRQRILEIWQEELIDRFGLNEMFWEIKGKYFCELLRDHLRKVKSVRESGLGGLGAEWSEIMNQRICNEMGKFKDEETKRAVLRLWSQVLVEQERSLMDSAVADLLNVQLPRIYRKLMKIGNYLKDDDIIGYAYTVAANYHGNMKKPEKVLGYTLKAYPLLKVRNGEKYGKLKDMAISYAYLNKKEEVRRVRGEINKVRKRMDSSQIKCELYEGEARAEAILKNETASMESIEQGMEELKIVKEKGYKVLRKIQLVRARLELAAKIKSGGGLNEIERMGKDAQEAASKYGYPRHEKQIADLLEVVLN